MGRKEKLLSQLRNNPTNVRFQDLDRLLRWYGFECRKRGGSHHVYKRKGFSPITIPYRKPVKTIYVKKVLALIEECSDLERT